jgi:Xaa-Pro aminopeptidase
MTMVTDSERAWWDFYNARVWEVLSPQLEGEALTWLDAQCAPL